MKRVYRAAINVVKSLMGLIWSLVKLAYLFLFVIWEDWKSQKKNDKIVATLLLVLAIIFIVCLMVK